MDHFNAKGIGEYLVHFRSEHLFSSSFHTPGFHDCRMLKRSTTVYTGEVEECERYPDQNRLLPTILKAGEHLLQLFKLIEVKAAQRVSALLYQFVDHIYQRRISAFEVRRK